MHKNNQSKDPRNTLRDIERKEEAKYPCLDYFENRKEEKEVGGVEDRVCVSRV